MDCDILIVTSVLLAGHSVDCHFVVTFDFLSGMARDLADKESVVLMGAGDGGKGPLIFQLNGSPYRGFLEGRVDGERYQLLLHLSNMELKRPAAKESPNPEEAS